MKRDELSALVKKKWRILMPLVFAFLFAGYFGAREFWRWWDINQIYQGLVREETEFKSKTAVLKKDFDNLKQPDFLEKEARTRLNLKKEGESVLVVVGENNFPPEDFSSMGNGGQFEKESAFWFNLKNWRSYFFSP